MRKREPVADAQLFSPLPRFVKTCDLIAPGFFNFFVGFAVSVCCEKWKGAQIVQMKEKVANELAWSLERADRVRPKPVAHC
ncbi:hypothetical protein LMG27177_05606 [Paraburkholderia fynbosensis]|uniref:Uncharacterized protein n=1 Tax=Paraburkholderia fynbosensis TaxID=1200993 RepID=A0A6J5GQR4_9BURK|nr:hypothetical protein LMG27177_05606 [Paraburkholderia fynbosensis]